jgi:hypothetical protein
MNLHSSYHFILKHFIYLLVIFMVRNQIKTNRHKKIFQNPILV